MFGSTTPTDENCVLIATQALYLPERDKPVYMGKARFEFPPNYSVLRTPGASNIYRLLRMVDSEHLEPLMDFDAHLTDQRGLGPLGEMSFNPKWSAVFNPIGPRLVELNVPYDLCDGSPFFEELKRWTVKEPVILK